jgi:hypothetical protein
MRIIFSGLMLAGAILSIRPVEARPRDDAMAGAYRCSVIADSQSWLECYYGAAQPARAALGLPPALAGQVKLAASPPGGGAPHDETLRDDVLAGAAGCARTAADRAWLDCYYSAAAPMRSRLGLSQARPLPQTAPRMTAARSAPAGPPPMPPSTGLLNGLFNTVRPVVRKMAMKSFELDRKGAFTVTLADGQVWKQSDEDEVYHPAHWRNAGPDVLVTIAPDAMHTFTMTVEGEQRFYKVRRIH